MVQRSKTLMFKTYQLFKDWYLYMKQSFNSLTIKYLKPTTGTTNIRVVIVY
jgi:hypothetical protein